MSATRCAVPGLEPRAWGSCTSSCAPPAPWHRHLLSLGAGVISRQYPVACGAAPRDAPCVGPDLQLATPGGRGRSNFLLKPRRAYQLCRKPDAWFGVGTLRAAFSHVSRVAPALHPLPDQAPGSSLRSRELSGKNSPQRSKMCRHGEPSSKRAVASPPFARPCITPRRSSPPTNHEERWGDHSFALDSVMLDGAGAPVRFPCYVTLACGAAFGVRCAPALASTTPRPRKRGPFGLTLFADGWGRGVTFDGCRVHANIPLPRFARKPRLRSLRSGAGVSVLRHRLREKVA